MVKIRIRVRVAKGFYGKIQKTNAAKNLRIFAKGVYISPNLEETGS